MAFGVYMTPGSGLVVQPTGGGTTPPFYPYPRGSRHRCDPYPVPPFEHGRYPTAYFRCGCGFGVSVELTPTEELTTAPYFGLPRIDKAAQQENLPTAFIATVSGGDEALAKTLTTLWELTHAG